MSALQPDLLDRLARYGEVVAVRDLVGGRGGRTLAVEHRPAGGAVAVTVVTVVHLRRGSPDALEREAWATRRAHEAGVGPEVLDVDLAHGTVVTRWVPGQVLTAAGLRDDAVLADVARSVRLLHDAPLAATGAAAATVPLRDLDPLGVRAAYLETAAARGLRWDDAVLAEEHRTDEVAALLAHGGGVPVGCHGDLVPANLVRTDGRVVLLDHEYAGLGERAFDLGGLAATAELDDRALAVLVAAYDGGSGLVTLERVVQWRDVVRHAWYVWTALGEHLGPQREQWLAWAARVRTGWAAGGAGGAGGVAWSRVG